MDNDLTNQVTLAAHTLKAADFLNEVSLELPWRVKRTPYRVFLAEFLLVRTRTDVIARVFDEIVFAYPDINKLSNAPEEELTSVLKPLGLRKRVPILIRAANYIVSIHNGMIPTTISDLLKVPGLGLYTSVAIAAFAFDSYDVPADVNILRFLSRLTGLEMTHPTKGSEKIRELLPLLSKTNSGPPAEKLLDFSRLVCRPRRPKCLDCPLQSQCHYFVNNYSH
jgi:A/G-specific adenine glycosylase